HLVLLLELEQAVMRRRGDRALPFTIDMRFEESHLQSRRGEGKVVRTIVHISIRPSRARDRRHRELHDQAHQLFASIKSYLMAWDSDTAESAVVESERE